MAFNLGAFAGGLAEAGSDSFYKYKEQERRAAEMKQRQEIHDAWKKEQAENEQLKALAGETFGRVDQPAAFRTAGGEMGPQPEGAQPALPADAATAFPAQKMYSRDQALKDFQAKAMGINPMKAMEYETKSLQTEGLRQGIKKGVYELKNLERGAQFDTKFDEFNEETQKQAVKLRQDISQHVDQEGIKGAIKKYGTQYQQATGHTVSQMGNSVVIKDKDGKTLGSFTDPTDIVNGLTDALGHKLMMSRADAMVTAGVFKNPGELQTYLKDRSTMRTQEATAAAATSNAQANMISARASAQNASTQAQLAVSHAALYNAQAAMSSAHADLFRQSIKTAENNTQAKEAMQPYLDKIAEIKDPLSDEGRREVEKLTLQAVTAGAKHSSDMVKLLGELKKPDKSHSLEVDPEAKKAAYKELSEVGTDPKAIAAVKAKWSNVFGPTATDKAIAAAIAKRENPTAAAPAPATPAPAAIPPTNAAPTSTVPAAALPANAPAVTKSTAYGKTGYQIKGVIGVFGSPEEAQAAWTQKYAPKAPASFD